IYFFFSSRRRHTRFSRDWSSDVCSSDLSRLEKETNFQYFLLDTVDIQKLIAQYFAGQVTNAYLYHPDENYLIKHLKEKITINKRSEERRVGKECRYQR